MASSRHPLQSASDPRCARRGAARVNLLAIETSTEFLSLALSRGEELHAYHREAGQRHAELILDSISALLGRAGMGLGDLDGLAYGEGPGSFTGLRIGCGVVQGLALARGLKVLGVGTLLALAEQAAEQAAVPAIEEAAAGQVVACLDARMGEIYHAAYRRSRDGWETVHAPGLCRPQDCPVPSGTAWIGAGSGFAAYGPVLRERFGSTLERTEPGVAPTAVAVLRLARQRFARGDGAAAESAIPVYIRDKVALKTSER
jgi:tRNA threonylcarbamoyladenosine biosynthesis protein TsaB